jgi:tRNA G10  N-methylase Trm11
MMQILITGREQDLSLAEIECLFGDVKKLNDYAALINQTQPINISKLGGTIKVANYICELSMVNTRQIIDTCLKYIIKDSPSSKFNFGFSYYGKKQPNILKIGIGLKRELQQAGLRPRLVESKNGNINAASVKHNKLITGYEFLLLENHKQLIIARTISAQDVDSYAKRDYAKPCRNSKVGMLPPKLSQILINLANPKPNHIVVDPFCGSGGLAIEASLMGYSVDVSDIDSVMVECTNTNIEWFQNEFSPTGKIIMQGQLDATKRSYPTTPYVIASEGYLGYNFSSIPKIDQVKSQIPILRKLYLDFFNNLNYQQKQPKRIAICLPFWIVGTNKFELNIVDDIIKLGYTKPEFQSVRSSVLGYHRKGQYTGRQILVLNSK